MADYRMTKEQKAFLDSLVCQRISDDEENKKVIEAFENPYSSPGITGALKGGWNTDKNDKVAFYIIKDPKDNQPLLFFSLKCGELHLPLDPVRLNKSVTTALMLLQAAVTRCGYPVVPYSRHPRRQKLLHYMAMDALDHAREVEVEDWAKEVIEKQLVDGTLPFKAWDNIWKRVFRSQGKLDSYTSDQELETSNIIQCQKTFPAVELVHFCAHEPARKKWKEMHMSQSMGKTLFWYFIEPTIRSIRDWIGCEYFYLFAADSNRTGNLVKLYQDMGFDFRDDLHIHKPAYDFCCFFMCQEVQRLRTRKNDFMKNYNKPKTPAAV